MSVLDHAIEQNAAELRDAFPQAGQPKLPPTAKGLVDRGLMRLDTSDRLPRLFFTESGMGELKAMIMDRRLADPARFAHVRQEVGIDPAPPESP